MNAAIQQQMTTKRPALGLSMLATARVVLARELGGKASAFGAGLETQSPLACNAHDSYYSDLPGVNWLQEPHIRGGHP